MEPPSQQTENPSMKSNVIEPPHSVGFGNITYSQLETELFKSLGREELLVLEPYAAYRTLAEICFLMDYKGKSVDSVRRCLLALNSLEGPRRLTKEYDAMIDLGIENKI